MPGSSLSSDESPLSLQFAAPSSTIAKELTQIYVFDSSPPADDKTQPIITERLLVTDPLGDSSTFAPSMHPAELVVDRGDIIAAPLPGPLSCSSSPAVPAEVLPTPFACSTGSPQTHRPPANVEAAPIPVEQPATSIVLSNLSKSTLPPQFMESTKLDYPVPEITPGEDANPEAILSPPRHAYTMSSSPPDPVIAPLPAPENSFASTLFSTLNGEDMPVASASAFCPTTDSPPTLSAMPNSSNLQPTTTPSTSSLGLDRIMQPSKAAACEELDVIMMDSLAPVPTIPTITMHEHRADSKPSEASPALPEQKPAVSSPGKKRARSTVSENEAPQQADAAPRSPKRPRLANPNTPVLPAQGKAAVSQARSFKKLSTPFRSPLASPLANRATPPAAAKPSPLAKQFKKPAVVSRLVRETTDAAVTSPFRSPVAAASSSPAPAPATILTVQALERRVQHLKRAIKITTEGGDDELERLVAKWRGAARAASWDLWALVKDGRREGDGGAAEKKDGWGWDDGAKPSAASFGWDDKDEGSGGPTPWDDAVGSDAAREAYEDAVEDEDDAETAAPKEPTVGTMLTELGIAADTLGWQEEEGEFVDA